MDARRVTHADAPEEVSAMTHDDGVGDAADQAERLTMVMEAEAIRNALAGNSDGEGSLGEYPYPLEDTESVLAEEDAEDSSDDPFHAGGLDPAPWVPAEQAAMHIVDPDDPDDPEDGRYVEEILDDADVEIDPFDRPGAPMTAEDRTLAGLDPYEVDEVRLERDGV